MSEPLKPIGFWSYTSSDDKSSGGRLSQLRRLLADELQLLIGRRQAVHIFQDVAAIPHGANWLNEIHKAVDQSSFLIPVVTPAFLESEFCCLEVMRFREREQNLGRDDLIFPFVYIDVADIRHDEVHDPAVLALLKSRQRIDFTALRLRSPESEAVATMLASFATSIRVALRKGSGDPLPQARGPSAAAVRPASASQPEEIQRARTARPGVVAAAPFPATVTDAPTSGALSPIEPEMIEIQAGSFIMGVPEAETEREGTEMWDKFARPLHTVAIARPFLLAKCPVTRAEYAVFAQETNREWRKPGFAQTDRHPAVYVSFEDAAAYAKWLSDRTGRQYRLSSEAEWEYACRAGTRTARYWGEKMDRSRANNGTKGTTPVDAFPPNPWGLHDMLGNVWEWTADHWHENYDGAPEDGSVWETNGDPGRRVVRGGSWDDVPEDCRAGRRVRDVTGSRDYDLGFRLARTL